MPHSRHVSPIKAVIAAGSHLFPSRTEKLSPLAPMVLHTRGRVGSRHPIRQALEPIGSGALLYRELKERAPCNPSEGDKSE